MAKQEVIDGFKRTFPASPEPRVFRAPGRVNLIGEHTDYNLGFVCPTALDMACFVATAPNSDGHLRVYSENRQQMREWPAAGVASLQPAKDWTDYVIGVARQVHQLGFPVAPLDMYIWSTVPVGSGLSSSAALEVSTALAFLNDHRIDPVELALLARRAENQFVGMPCGIMDQYVSVFGREHAAVKIDCRSLGYETVPLPESVEIIAVNSMVKHELGQSAYRERVQECAFVVEALRKKHPEVQSLRDATVDMIKELLTEIPAVPRKRARHVVSEDLRVEQFVEASAAGNTGKMGDLFVASHRSLQNDYEVSCEELDFLVDTALTLPGVWGARMTGGGFGGCTVNLVRPEEAARFREGIAEAYRSRYGITPDVYPCRPSAGACEL